MSEKEKAEAQAARFMILGALSQESDEVKAAYQVAYDELKIVLNKHDDMGKIALAVLTAEIAVEAHS